MKKLENILSMIALVLMLFTYFADMTNLMILAGFIAVINRIDYHSEK